MNLLTTELEPFCRWRGQETRPDRYECFSPKLVVSGRGVTLADCARCYCCNHGLSGERVDTIPPLTEFSIGPVRVSRPRVVATLAVAGPGRDLLEISRPSLQRYAARIDADYHEIKIPASPYALGEKFRLRTLLDHWERVLFLDADILVSPGCPDLFDLVPRGTVGIHDDLDDIRRLVGVEWLAEQYEALLESQGEPYPPGWSTTCLNTGVVVFDRAHPDLFESPPLPYPGFHCAEQNLVNLNLWRFGYPVQHLPKHFNYQWWAYPGMRGPAYMWHYAKPVGASEPLRLAVMRAHAQGRPGHHLKRILEELGQISQGGCQCEKRANQMDEWGLAGCREHRAEIVGWVREGWGALGWGDKARAVIRGLWAGHRNMADPFGSVVDEVFRRAAQEVGEIWEQPVSTTPSVDISGKRHLLFHCMPVAGTPAWRTNCDHLIARLATFTGKKVCGIVTASSRCKRPLDPPEAVREYLEPYGFECFEVPNDYRLREVATWDGLWGRLEFGLEDLVFYCHSKGATKPWNPGVTCHTWGRVMYTWLLDYLPQMEELLTQFPVVGLFPKLGRHFANSRSQWHYSGSFYWVRAAEVLRRKGAAKIDRTWFGVESWPGSVFLPDEMGCPHDPRLTAEIDLYQMDTWRNRLLPMFRQWLETQRGLVRRAVPALDL